MSGDGGASVDIAPITHRELDALRALHMEVFGDTMGVSLGRFYQRLFLRTFLELRTAAAIGAFDGGRLVGYVFGLQATDLGTLNRAVLPAALASLAAQPRLWLRHDVRHEMKRRARSLLGLEQAHVASPAVHDIHEDHIFELVGIGSDAAARGRGIGEVLIRVFSDIARQRGNRMVRLTVYDHNSGARRLYARCGFVERGYVPGAKTIICELTL